MTLSVVRLSDVYLSVAYIGPKSRTERPRKTKIGKKVAPSLVTTTPLSRSKSQRSMSPGRITHRGVNASGSCSGERGNQCCIDISKISKYRFDIDISYRIVSPAEISTFSIYRDIKFRYIILLNFHSFIHSRLDLAVFHVSSVAQKIENSQKIAATTAATGLLTDLIEQSEMKAECFSWEWLRKKAAQKTERERAVPRENAVQRELEMFLAAPNIPIYQSLDDDASRPTSHHDAAGPILTPLQWWASHNNNIKICLRLYACCWQFLLLQCQAKDFSPKLDILCLIAAVA